MMTSNQVWKWQTRFASKACMVMWTRKSCNEQKAAVWQLSSPQMYSYIYTFLGNHQDCVSLKYCALTHTAWGKTGEGRGLCTKL